MLDVDHAPPKAGPAMGPLPTSPLPTRPLHGDRLPTDPLPMAVAATPGAPDAGGTVRDGAPESDPSVSAPRATSAILFAWLTCAALVAAELVWLMRPGVADLQIDPLTAALALTVGLIAAGAAAHGGLHLYGSLRTERLRCEACTTVDELTGLHNRRRIRDAMERELALTQRIGQPFSLVILDIDSLRVINEHGGVGLGDAVVRRVGAHCRRSLRASDLSGRWDGDAFMLLLPATDEAGCRALIDRLCKAISAENVGYPGDHPLHVTATAGAVTYHPPLRLYRRVGEASSLVAIAERALNRAKVMGGGSAVVETTHALMT